MRPSLAVSVLLLAGCQITLADETAKYDGGVDAGPRDAAAVDARTPDASRRDAGRPRDGGGGPASCAEVLAASPGAPSGVYTIAPAGRPFDAYCDMDGEGGGWTLAAKIISGASSSWLYDSSWWTERSAPIDPSPDLSEEEARYEPFVVMPFQTIRLVDDAGEREVHLDDEGTSLVALFSDTAPPGIEGVVDNGPAAEDPPERAATVARYDDSAFSRESSHDWGSICETIEADGPWASSVGLGYNAAGAYRSTSRVAFGRARIGTWSGGSNAYVWSQTADCVFGLGVETTGYGGTIASGTTMGTFTTVWIR